jgi:hypothetical protein
MAVNPNDKKITTKNIPKAFEAANRTGSIFPKSKVFETSKYPPNPKTPTATNMPYIIRLFIMALFSFYKIENSPAS